MVDELCEDCGIGIVKGTPSDRSPGSGWEESRAGLWARLGAWCAALAVFGVIFGVGFGLTERWFGVGPPLLERRLHQYTLLGQKVADKEMGGFLGIGRICTKRWRAFPGNSGAD